VVTTVRPRFGPERSADSAAGLVPPEARFAVDVEVVAGVHRVVAVEPEAAAGEPVAARLGQDVDLPAGAAPVLGAVAVRGDAELADGLHAEGRAGGAAGRAVGEVVLQRAVEEVGVGARVLTVDAHRQPVGHDRAVVAIGEHRDAGEELHQVGVVAAVDRDLLDGPLVGQIAEVAGLGAEPGRALHGDLLGAADLQRQRDRGALADG
jgi:hypothetical protein